MDPVTLGMAKADAAKKVRTVAPRVLPGILPAPIAAGRVARHGAWINLNGYTSQRVYKMYTDATTVRFVFQNWACASGGGNEVSLGAFTIKASVLFDYGTANAVLVPIYFQGVQTVTLNQFQTMVSDPVDVSFTTTKGSYFAVRTYTTMAGAFLPYMQDAAINGLGGMLEGHTASDVTNSAGFTFSSSFTLGKLSYGPNAVCGWPSSGSQAPSVYLSGDSIMAGTDWNANESASSFSQYALDAAGIGAVSGARGGETAGNAASYPLYYRRIALARGCQYAIDQYGTNDLAAGSTAAQIKTALLSHWNNLTARGMKVYRTTIIPRNSSSDGWSTLTGQSASSFEAARQAINQWLRAPASAGAGNSARYDSGGKMLGLFDVAATLEVNSDGTVPTINPATGALSGTGGYWLTDPTVYATGTVTSATASSLGDTSKTWVAGQWVGYQVVITADPTTPASVGSFGHVTASTTNALSNLFQAFVTPPSVGATYRIYKGYTTDGTHPTAFGHLKMATAVDTSVFVAT